ncbi:MAG: polyhydroxyalkanoic acid system family protein [Desulfobacterales bacterium]|jgi:hypothetical protein
MADIRISRHHCIKEPELRHQLEKLAGEMKKKFGIQSDFRENRVCLSGKPLKHGEVAWTSDTLSVNLTFDLMGKVFKKPIQSEIESQIDAMIA